MTEQEPNTRTDKPEDPYDKPPERKQRVDPYGNPLPGNKAHDQQKGRYVRVQFPGAVARPWVTYALLFINAVIFGLRYVDVELAVQLLQWGAIDVDAVVRGREVYRLLSGMFLHADEAHILFNGLALYYIGSNLERIFGHVRFALIYFLGGLMGSVFAVLLGNGGIGASGAVFAIFGAEAFFMYAHRRLFGAVALQRLRSSAILIAFNFIFGIVVNTANTLTDSGAQIANMAHLGGLIGGVVMAWLIAPRFIAKKVENPQQGKPPIHIVEGNPLHKKIQHVLYYSVVMAIMLLSAILLRG